MCTIENILTRIKIYRKLRGYSHENMAADLGISQAAYTLLENNKSKITLDRLIKISKILEVSIHDLIYFNENSKSENMNEELEKLRREIGDIKSIISKKK